MSYIGNKPANKPVVASDLDPTVITGQTALAVAPADTDEFLISDAGTLKRLDASLIGGGGKVLQVLTATDQTSRSTTSTSFVTASNTLSVDITPSATSSKIFITASFETGTGSGARGFWTIYKDSTNLGHTNGMFSSSAGSVSTDGMSGSLTFLDSPSSTSELTYAVYMKTNGTSCNMNANTVKGSIVVMEIGA